MKNYAMICEGDLIEVLYNQKEIPKWPPNSLGVEVIAIECEPKVTRDWKYNFETKEFYDPQEKREIENLIENTVPDYEILPKEEDLEIELMKQMVQDEYTLEFIRTFI